MKSKTIIHNGFSITCELGDDPLVETTIAKESRGEYFSGSLARADNDGVIDSEDWDKTIKVPSVIINKALDLEEEFLGDI
mgnify:FL=1